MESSECQLVLEDFVNRLSRVIDTKLCNHLTFDQLQKYFKGEIAFKALEKSQRSILYRMFETMQTSIELTGNEIGRGYPLDTYINW